MGTAKHRNLTVDTLTVTGSISLPDGALPEAVPAETPAPAPHPGPLPDRPTVAALAARQDAILSILVGAGLITPEEPAQAPEAPAGAPAPEKTPQAVTAGVVDGA